MFPKVLGNRHRMPLTQYLISNSVNCTILPIILSRLQFHQGKCNSAVSPKTDIGVIITKLRRRRSRDASNSGEGIPRKWQPAMTCWLYWRILSHANNITITNSSTQYATHISFFYFSVRTPYYPFVAVTDVIWPKLWIIRENSRLCLMIYTLWHTERRISGLSYWYAAPWLHCCRNWGSWCFRRSSKLMTTCFLEEELHSIRFPEGTAVCF